MAASLYWPLDSVNTWGDKSLAYVQGKTNAHFDQMLLDSDIKYTAATGKPTAKQLHAFEIRQINIDRQNAILTPVGAPIIEYKLLFKLATQDWLYFFAFGFLLTIIGFWNWYFKLQKYEDKAVRLSAETKSVSQEVAEASKSESSDENETQESKAEL